MNETHVRGGITNKALSPALYHRRRKIMMLAAIVTLS
jgi:hypothetical protein